MSVYFDKSRNKFMARVTINGKRVYLGRFDTRAEAEYVVQDHKNSAAAVFQTMQLPQPVFAASFEMPERQRPLSRIISFFKRG